MDGNEILKFVLKGLAKGYEQHSRQWVTMRPETTEEQLAFPKIFARLRSEGAIVELAPGIAQFTALGYKKYQPQIDSWHNQDFAGPVPPPSMNGKLDTGLLLKIMRRLGELRSNRPWFFMSDRLFDLAPHKIQEAGDQQAAYYVDAHLEFLQGCGFVELGEPQMMIPTRSVKLTTAGNIFVQPELAEFSVAPLLPEVVKRLEESVQVLTYPESDKDALLYRLREAFAKRAPDLLVTAMIEIGSKLASRGHGT